MADSLYSQTFPAGSTIFTEGEEGDVAYIIESGAIEISTTEHGIPVVLGTLEKGQLLGEMAMIDRAPRTATAVALIETTLSVVNRDQLHERLESAEPIIKLLVDLIMSRYRSGLSKVKGTPLADQLNAPLAEENMKTSNHAVEKIRMENDLRSAVENNELAVYFQPLLDIKQNSWGGFEALIRWIHPERGFVSPLDFITLAEETDLIHSIGLFVLRTACENLVELQAIRDKVLPGQKPLFVGVNVSSKQMGNIEFIDQIADVVKETGLKPSSLKLEITESMAADYKTVIEWVRHCKELGFTVAIDDFGTGYSSLEHLLELDVDTLKIDQAFVRELGTHEKSERLVRGVVNLSKSLGYSIVAEGIEDKQQLDILSKLECEYGQGYFIGKPQTLDDIRQHIEAGE